jgi:hypothetical protein
MKTSAKCLSILILIVLFGGTASALDIKFTDLRLEFASGYDDNILRYSDRDLDNFENNLEVYPSKLSAYDDWNNELRLKLYAEVSEKGKNPVKFKYFGKVSSFYRNPFNNYTNHTFLVNFDPSEKIGLGFRYFYMPDYYLREYKDKDTNTYQSCAFDDNQFGGNIEYRFNKNTSVGIQAQYEQIYYNKYFTEYDCNLWSFSGDVSQKLTNNLRGSFSAGMAFADNIGYVPVSSAAQANYFNEDTEYGDGSYNEEIYQVDLRYRLKKLLGQDTWLNLQYKLRHRIYETDNSLVADPMHASRQDDRHRIVFGVDRKITEKLNGFLNYTHEWRKSISDNPGVDDAKDFTQNVFVIGFEYSFK